MPSKTVAIQIASLLTLASCRSEPVCPSVSPGMSRDEVRRIAGTPTSQLVPSPATYPTVSVIYNYEGPKGRTCSIYFDQEGEVYSFSLTWTEK